MRDFDSICREFQPKIQRHLYHLVDENEAADLTTPTLRVNFLFPVV